MQAWQTTILFIEFGFVLLSCSHSLLRYAEQSDVVALNVSAEFPQVQPKIFSLPQVTHGSVRIGIDPANATMEIIPNDAVQMSEGKTDEQHAPDIR